MSQTIHLPQADIDDGANVGHSRGPGDGSDGGDRFGARLGVDGQTLERASLATLQLNLGKMCNLACHHCHVEAGPERDEIMTWPTIQRILDWIDQYHDDHTLQVADLTGGAPEMNPHFRELVAALRRRGMHVLDRSNLTIFLEPDYEDLPRFLAEHDVEIVASLPCYMADNVDKQRGKGVFNESIVALQRLNDVGYGHPQNEPGSELRLDLVYNPVGYGLPPDQGELEQAYKQHLWDEFGIVFNRLWTITNMPIKRFAHALRRDGAYDNYMHKLETAHNPCNVEQVMCRYLVSVGWRGAVYDCDFNQMLQMPLDPAGYGPGDEEHQVEANSRKLWEFTPGELIGRKIRTDSHCFGCTAGAGSSCTGALA